MGNDTPLQCFMHKPRFASDCMGSDYILSFSEVDGIPLGAPSQPPSVFGINRMPSTHGQSW